MAQRGDRQRRVGPGKRGGMRGAFRKGLKRGGENVNVKGRTRGSVAPHSSQGRRLDKVTDRLREGVAGDWGGTKPWWHQASTCWEHGPGAEREAGVCGDISLDGSNRGEMEGREE